MIDLELLKSLGCDTDALKKLFATERENMSDKAKAFVDRMQARIQEGINGNITMGRLWFSIDRAVDTSMFAKSRTLFQGLLDNKHDEKTVLSMVKEWGFDDWSQDVCGCGNNCTNVGTCSQQKKRINIPAFFEVTFPIALAMKTVRVAKLFNERNLFPQFKYEPLVSTPEIRLKCDIVTHRVQVQAQQMEYKAILKQVINQTCTYSYCQLFPRESWWADQQPTKEFSGEGKSRKRKKRTVREGVRYDHPHPSRCYRDLAYPAYTLNSGTGCKFSGHWGLVRYGEVASNPDYYNTDKITFGRDSFRITDTNRTFFATVMPCQMEFPKLNGNADSAGGTLDREEKMQEYTTDDHDSAVLLTHHFECLNPLRDLGLKNKDGEGYDGDVWFRCDVCSDDTIVYAEPLSYNPNLVCLYDPDANKSVVTSLVMECIPTQDMVGNLLSQAILQAKNNLTNINFYNTDVLDSTVIDDIKNLGEKAYRSPQFVPFSQHESRALDSDKREAVIPVPIQRQSIGECLNLINTCLDILARGLVMSAHELGQSDTHEVTAQEVLTRAGSTSTRLSYTASGVDDFIYAWQRQLHDAGIAHWDDEIFAEVALNNDKADKDALEKLGFKIETTNAIERKVGVRGDKKSIELDTFTARRDAPDRVNSVAMATAMTNFFQSFVNNPMAMQTIGVDQFVDLTNGILDAFQFRKDWRLTAKTDVFKEQKEMAEKQAEDAKEMAQSQSSGAIMEQLKAIVGQIKQDTLAEVGAQLEPVMKQAAQLDAHQQEEIHNLQDVAGKMIQLLQGHGILPVSQAQQPQPQPQPQQNQIL